MMRNLSQVPLEELLNYFRTALKIGEHIIALGNRGMRSSKSLSVSLPNPSCERIPFNGGLALRLYDGRPSSLLTSFGRMNLHGSDLNDKEAVMKQLTETFGLELSLPKKVDFMGPHGPIYSLTKDTEGHSLPKPRLEKIAVESRNNIDLNLDPYYWAQLEAELEKAAQAFVSQSEGPKVPAATILSRFFVTCEPNTPVGVPTGRPRLH